MGFKLGRVLRKAAKYIPAVIGAVGGTMLGGPAAAIAAASLGGTLARSRKNKLKGALEGAGIGTAYTALAPMVVQGLAKAGGSSLITPTLEKAVGLTKPSLLSQIGIQSAPTTGGGLGFFGNVGTTGVIDKMLAPKIAGFAKPAAGVLGANTLMGGMRREALPEQQESFFEKAAPKSLFEKVLEPRSVFGKVLQSGAKNLLEGTRGSKFQPPPYQTPGHDFGTVHIGPMAGHPIGNLSPLGFAPGLPHFPLPSAMSAAQDPNATALEKLLQILQILEAEEKNSHLKQEIPQFKEGGYVDGSDGGQDDTVPTHLEEGSYVMDGTTTSLFGDGNSHNGGHKFQKMEDSFLKSGIIRNPERSYRTRVIKAKVSPGEFVFKKEFVDKLGNGDNKKGAKVLDNFRNNLRNHKGVNKFLPPKSKSFEQYVKKGRNH